VTHVIVAQSNIDLQTEEALVRKLETVLRLITRRFIMSFIFLVEHPDVVTITDNTLLAVIFI
jgi:ABC-type iron transport system FetAB permease component